MATYVLVGGAWMGSWVWRDVTQRLRALGHDVFPATLTGLGDRVHLAAPAVDLDTHITDVLNLMAYADLEQVILVGHSYAGSVVTGVADRAPERLSVLVYCDSAPFDAGVSMLDLNSPEGQDTLRRTVHEQGDGWLLPFPGVDDLGASIRGIDGAGRELMQRKAAAQPFATWTTPLRLDSPPGPPSYRRVMIVCDDGRQTLAFARSNPGVSPALDQVVAGNGWELRELDTGHWPMLSAPAELATLLADLAGPGHRYNMT